MAQAETHLIETMSGWIGPMCYTHRSLERRSVRTYLTLVNIFNLEVLSGRDHRINQPRGFM